jgi:hypothetical protein
MQESTTNLQEEERQLRERIGELRRELEALQARLDAICREREQRPRVRNFRTDFRIAATAGAKRQDQPPGVVTVRPKSRPPTDPLEELRRSPRGTALFAPVSGEVALLVRADEEQLAQLEGHPEVEFRAGLFTLADAGVVLIPILVRVGPEERETIYEAWGNDYAAGLDNLLQAFATQESIAVHFYSDGNRLAQTVRVDNELQPFASEAQRMSLGATELSEDAFHQARQAVYRQYPSVRALWKALKA